jgi:hypothetical protein
MCHFIFSISYPLLGMMPVSLAIILGENKTNRELAASPDLLRQLTLGILT